MEFIQVPSPNFNSGRNWQRIKKIFIHWVGKGTAESASKYFQNPDSKVSAHYIVGDDLIYQCVQEKDTAWHAGVWDENLQSIGIEHEARPDYPATDETYRTSAELIKEISKRYDIPLDKEHIVPHNSVKATACPGSMDIDRLIELASGDPTNPCEAVEIEKDRYKKEARAGRVIIEEQAKEIQEKNQDIERLQDELIQEKTTVSSLASKLTDKTSDYDSAIVEINALEDVVGDQGALLEAYEDDILKLEARVEKMKNEGTLFAYSWKERFISLFLRK